MFNLGEAGANFSTENFEEQLRKMADEANKVLTEQSRDPEFSATIAQTLRNLSENTEKMQVIIIFKFNCINNVFYYLI